ncbi:MAG TPA: class I SAM-dependent methyltransferase [bacterium]|nr:class I SAM-dependent methyltransferase [bacterium]
MKRSNVYEYESFLSEYYDLVPGYAKRADRNFYVDAARLASGKTLELGCGTGRILIPTAQAGCEIVGLDISESMLATCRKNLLEQPDDVQKRVTTVQRDMTNFDLKERFSLITAPFRSFSHLIPVKEQLFCLDCVRRHLLPGGRFSLELFQTHPQRINNPKYLNEVEDTPEFELPDGRKLRRTNRVVAFHRPEQYNDVEIIFYVTHPDGRTERLVQAFRFRYFFRYEVEHLLARCGFEIVDLFGNFDRSPLTDDSPEMIFVAQACV